MKAKWNCRLIHNPSNNSISVHEVHYDAEGNPWAWTEKPCISEGVSVEDIQWYSNTIKKSFDKPVLRISHEGYLEEAR